MPQHIAHRVASSFGSAGPGAGAASGSSQPHALVHSVQLAFAHSTQTVFYVMAAVLAAGFIMTVRWLPRGRLETADDRA